MDFPLTIEGIIFMTLGWGFVFSLLFTCLYKVFKSGNNLESSK